MEKVSAVITTHNRCKLLDEALQSVLNQTYKNMEYIIVNDNSTDDTKDYLSSLDDERIKVINIGASESKGGNYARNRGIMAATGEYIAFLDDDDRWLPEKIEKQVECFRENNKLGMVYCGHEDSYMDGKYTCTVIPSEDMRGNLKDEIFAKYIATTSMIMIPKKVMLDVGMFDESVKYWQEYDLCIRICQKYSVDFVAESLMVLRHDINDSNRRSNHFAEWLLAVKQQNDKFYDYIKNLNPEIKERRRIMIYNDAWYRCDIRHDKKRMRHYAFFIWKHTHNIKYLVSAILGVGHVFLVKVKGSI